MSANLFQRVSFASLLIISVSLIGSNQSFAQGNVRMYQINKKQQLKRIGLGAAAQQVGCHNLFRGKQVFRFVQLGFEWCSVYTEDDCAAASIKPALWTGREYRRVKFDQSIPQEKLFPGDKWQLASNGLAIQSWYCKAQP